MDESSYRIAPSIKQGWYLKGKDSQARINFTRDKFYSFGALTSNLFCCKFYQKANTDSFLDFMESLQKQYGKLLLFADNAAYHKSNRVKQFLAESKGDVVIRYFPKYTPQLNPIEIQWRDIKKSIGNSFFEDASTMQDTIKNVISSGEVSVVKVFKYLTP